MKILVAEDDAFFRRLLQQVLADEFELVLCEDGNQAWEILQRAEGPQLAILDWVMPGMTGPQVCRRVRHSREFSGHYLIILTARNSSADILSALRAGADDYVTKPFDPEELRARVRVGQRVVLLQETLARQTHAINAGLDREERLAGFLPICPKCRRIRADANYWLQVEDYLDQHAKTAYELSGCAICVHAVDPSGPPAWKTHCPGPLEAQSSAQLPSKL